MCWLLAGKWIVCKIHFGENILGGKHLVIPSPPCIPSCSPKEFSTASLIATHRQADLSFFKPYNGSISRTFNMPFWILMAFSFFLHNMSLLISFSRETLESKALLSRKDWMLLKYISGQSFMMPFFSNYDMDHKNVTNRWLKWQDEPFFSHCWSAHGMD